MQENEKVLPQEIYFSFLMEINNIKFSHREIDVIACLVHGRSAKKIASFLSISPKTVAVHIRNIMLKLECNSRDSILDFIERSKKYNSLKSYYYCLVVQTAFETLLKDIKKKNSEEKSCLIVYWKSLEEDITYLQSLEKHIKLAGLDTFIEAREEENFSPYSAKNIPSQNLDYILYFIPLKFLKDSNALEKTDISLFLSGLTSSKKNFLFLLPQREVVQDLPEDLNQLNYVDFSEHNNYYLSVFEVLKKFLPKLDSTLMIEEFKRHCQTTFGTLASTSPSLLPENLPLEEDNFLRKNSFLSMIFQKKSFFLISILVSFIIFSVFLLIFNRSTPYYNTKSKESSLSLNQKTYETPSIRSDLLLPIKTSFLSRPELISQIGDIFKVREGIQTVTLAGVGGSGKTTLARAFASSHEFPLVWEINAETRETLKGSFENLAQALAKDEESKGALEAIEAIQDSIKREDKIIGFVKEQLKKITPWFLIYDNVEKFADIQKYFPCDTHTWGHGKIILTTRNLNNEHNQRINKMIVIGELNSDQKLALFTQIMENRAPPFHPTPVPSHEEVKRFLEKIPSFPLVVSTAAYYLKTTNISHDQYIEKLSHSAKNFIQMQKNLLKDAGNYAHTRNEIITLSLQNIIEADKNFIDLLLFIGLLNSQCIPLELLSKFRNPEMVDKFIYKLKEYSLVTNSLSSQFYSIPSISLHRSTQEIILSYLTKLLHLKENKEYVNDIAKTLGSYIAEAHDLNNSTKRQILINHCEMFLKHAPLLPAASRGSIQITLGRLYHHAVDHIRAKKVLIAGIKTLENVEASKLRNNISSLLYLGQAYGGLGGFKKSREYFEEALSLYKKQGLEDTLEIANALFQLGKTYGGLGEYQKEKEAFEKSIIIYKKLCPRHYQLKIASPLIFLGNTYANLGHYTQALQALEEGLKIYKEISSENHINYAWGLIHLGVVYGKLGEAKKYQACVEHAYKVYCTTKHPTLSWVLSHLGIVYNEVGLYDKARTTLEKSIELRQQMHVEEDSNLIWMYLNLGRVYTNLGQYENAKRLLKKCTKWYEKNYEYDHIKTARALESLGEVYFREGNLESAEQAMLQALSFFQENSHPDQYAVLEGLAKLYVKRSTLALNKGEKENSQTFQDQAISYLNQALDILNTHFPKDSPHLIRLTARLKNVQEQK